MFVEAIQRGDTSGIFRTTEKPDVTTTPVPRFDLLEFDAYDSMSIQFSRGVRFNANSATLLFSMVVSLELKPQHSC